MWWFDAGARRRAASFLQGKNELVSKNVPPSTAKRVSASVQLEAAERGSFSDNALSVLDKRYLRRDAQGQVVETPRELFARVAGHVASVEAEPEVWTTRFFDMMWSREFMPNSPTLMNAGRPLGMLSACFVLPLDDTIEDIMETARQIALVQRSGGGTGVDLSKLRPSGSIVASSGGRTEGPLAFLKLLSSVSDAIQQGASRRGANMGTMRIDHPDVMSFIVFKEDLTQVTNYNLSVTVPDAFMEALRATPKAAHVVVDPHTKRTGFLRRDGTGVDWDGPATDEHWKVGDVFDEIVTKAWSSGEPGLIFIDKVNEVNPTPNVGPMTSTNPCGEQPLLPYEACNLGSLNLAAFWREQPVTSSISDHGIDAALAEHLDLDALVDTVRAAIRFLDNVVEVNRYPTKEIDAVCRANRKIGLGVMGWADLLFHLGLSYDSPEGLAFAEAIGGLIQREAWDEDTRLAEEKGTFANWRGSRWDTVLDRKMRNAHTVTIAPTGTISILAGCSGGIEPIFSLAFRREIMRDEKGEATVLTEVNPVFEEALRAAGLSPADIAKVTDHAAGAGTLDGCPVALPDDVTRVFRSARDVSPEWHVRCQAAWQKHTDAAVSKTINFPGDASIDDVKQAYVQAWELGCKGITVYRDGSRTGQPMVVGDEAESENAEDITVSRAEARASVLDMLMEESS